MSWGSVLAEFWCESLQLPCQEGCRERKSLPSKDAEDWALGHLIISTPSQKQPDDVISNMTMKTNAASSL
eukprot:5503486-Amphidinium_carterae.1